jgi:hypothetical protein
MRARVPTTIPVTSLAELNQYISMLGKHDWDYEYSDNKSNIYRDGSRVFTELVLEKAISPVKAKAYLIWERFINQTIDKEERDRQLNTLRAHVLLELA